MKTILLPTDFSGNATNAARYAAGLTAQLKGKLLLVHVLEPQTAGAPEGAVVSLPPDPRLEIYYQEQLLKLSKQIRLDFGFLFELETICVQGNLPEQLNAIIQRKQVDLVVMGTKGAHNFIQKLAGTNTAGFIKIANCPVLAIPAKAEFKSIKVIAYASDLKTEESTFLHQLLQFTQPFSPVIYIVNVQTDEKFINEGSDVILQDLQTQFPDNNFCFAQLQNDNAVDGIRQFVLENQVDILAVSIHEKSLLHELFHWSVTRQLAFTSTVPLLALPAHPFQHPSPEKSGKPASQQAG